MRINEIILERVVDPAKLAQRVAGRYGHRTRYGNWESPIKGQHIPMKSFNSRNSDAVYQAYMKFRVGLRQYIDPNLSPIEQEHEIDRLFTASFQPVRISIRGLLATQPFVRIDDPELLQNKLGEMMPENIRIATYRGKNYIVDGHHAVAAAAIRGDKEIMARYINLDNPNIPMIK